MTMKIEKRLQDSHGEIIIRPMVDLETRDIRSGVNVAEIVAQGCVLAFYELRLVDKTNWVCELHEVSDRLTKVEVDDENLRQMLYWGRKVANTIVDFCIKD